MVGKRLIFCLKENKNFRKDIVYYNQKILNLKTQQNALIFVKTVINVQNMVINEQKTQYIAVFRIAKSNKKTY